MLHRVHTSISIVALSVGTVVIVHPRPVHAQEVVGCRADDKDRRNLLVIDNVKTLRPHLLRRFRGKVVESEPSNSGRYVGALVVNPESQKEGLWRFDFHVVNRLGKTVYEVKNAQAFKFSPDDRYAAVTVGLPLEGAGGFKPEGTTIVDLRAKTEWSVPELKDATEVDWTTLPDEGLTLVGKKPSGKQKVWAYRLKNRRAWATKWKGIHFSPDGEYYYMTPRETIEAGLCRPSNRDDSCIRAYQRKGDKEMKLPIRKRVRRIFGWAGIKGHELLMRDGIGKEEEAMQVDLATGRRQILKEKLNRKWKPRPGLRLIEEKKGQIRLRFNRLMDELEQNREERRRKRRKSDY